MHRNYDRGLVEVDWRYNENKLNLRQKCLTILLRKYGSHLNEDGSPEHTTESIYECAHDWVSQGHARPDGIVKYYEAYYGQQS